MNCVCEKEHLPKKSTKYFVSGDFVFTITFSNETDICYQIFNRSSNEYLHICNTHFKKIMNKFNDLNSVNINYPHQKEQNCDDVIIKKCMYSFSNAYIIDFTDSRIYLSEEMIYGIDELQRILEGLHN